MRQQIFLEMKLLITSVTFFIIALGTYFVYPNDRIIEINDFELNEMIKRNKGKSDSMLAECIQRNSSIGLKNPIKKGRNIPISPYEKYIRRGLKSDSLKTIDYYPGELDIESHCREILDSLEAISIFSDYIKAYKSEAVMGTSYLAFKKLNNLTPETVKNLSKSNGAGPLILNRVPEKWTTKQLKYLKGSKSILVGIMASSAVFTLIDDDKTPKAKIWIISISILISIFCLWRFLQYKDIVS